MKLSFACLLSITLAANGLAVSPSIPAPSIQGDYLEARSCDVYTGPCFANAEMGLTGKEGILTWAIRHGQWNGVSLEGLSIVAVVETTDTLGNLKNHPRQGRAVLVVDALANSEQQAALIDFARAAAGNLISTVTRTLTSPIETEIGTCAQSGCAKVKVDRLLEVTTRCLDDKDHLCGNEETFYPPLTEVTDAHPAYTQMFSYQGRDLQATWREVGQRSAFIARFSR